MYLHILSHGCESPWTNEGKQLKYKLEVSLNAGRINLPEADLGNKVEAMRTKIIFCGRAC